MPKKLFAKDYQPKRRLCKHIIGTNKPENTPITLEGENISTSASVIYCQALALKGQEYCFHHIYEHNPTYQRQQITLKPLDNIGTLTQYLNKLTNGENAYHKPDIVRTIGLLRKYIDTLNDSTKENARLFTKDKAELFITRVIEIVNANTHKEQARAIGLKLLDLSREYQGL